MTFLQQNRNFLPFSEQRLAKYVGYGLQFSKQFSRWWNLNFADGIQQLTSILLENSVVLVAPNVKVRMETQVCVLALSLYVILWESFTFTPILRVNIDTEISSPREMMHCSVL